VGAGISGLACAYYLRKAGVRAIVLEQSERAGGLIRSSVHENGFVLEEGPQSFLSTDLLLEMIGDLGLAGEVIRADPHAARFVLVNGELRRVPLSPQYMLASSLLGLRTKLTMLRDAAGHSSPPEGDESVAAFVRRKFTQELLDRLVGPFVSGIFAGDPERLSLRAAFATIYEAEKRFGSVICGAAKLRKATRSASDTEGSKHAQRDAPIQAIKHGLVSFRKGNEALIRALAHSLGENLICGVTVKGVSCDLRDFRSSDFRRGDSGAGDSPMVQRLAVHATQSGRQRTFDAAAVIVATPADVASRLVASLSANLAEHLAGIEYAPVAVVSSIYRRSHIANCLDGFGFLVPRGEGRRLLGTIWNSSLFAERAPEGFSVLTSFAGGATDPDLIALPARDITALISNELSTVLRISGEPIECSMKLYPRGIPQYNLGHTQTIASLRRLCAKFPGVYLCGNYLDGPSIGACVEQAQRIAALAARGLLSSRSAISNPKGC
jgi:protoporphyrinogen/coproporphyrinogen III oxidase